MAANINRVVLVGNLTRDPELRHTPSGTPVCSLRIAVNSRRRDESGQWTDKPNYFSISVFGNQAESCSQYLAKGRPVAVDGRLDWREWQAQDGAKRESVEIVAESVQFLGSRGDGGGEAGGGNQFVPAGAGSESSADFPAAADADTPFQESAGPQARGPRAGRRRPRAPRPRGALMNVILLKDVEKVGLRGDVVSVARGYARNSLFPRKLAEEATAARVAELQKRDTQRARHEAKTADEAQAIAAKLAATELRFEVKAGPTGSLFGSGTPTDIADVLWSTG